MNLTGKKYPRIFSISTVGIKNHNNADFLIHPLRTDFTGQSGTGKSMIAADIPQLILTAGKYYKSATQSNDPREYNELPLKKSQFAYAFMNLEVQNGKFIVIGVMIKRAPKQLLPFIIQKQMGIDADNNPKFKALERVIRFNDFLDNGEMLTPENFQRKFDKQQIYLTTFYHKTSAYHKLLKENRILHIDLSDDDNLQKQYAHSLKTLSRGKEIATEGNAFKRFLFTEDDVVAKKFREQSKAIEDDHRKYEEEWKTQNALSKKRTALNALLKLKKEKVKAHEERLTLEAAHYHQQYKQREKQLKDSIEQCFETELELFTVSERKNEIETEGINTELYGLLTKLKAEKKKYKTAKSDNLDIQKQLDTLGKLIEELEKPYKELDKKKTEIEAIEVLLKHYKTIEGIKTAFELQTITLLQKEKLQALNSFLSYKNLKNEFETSEYAKSFKPAIEFYSQKKPQINSEIAEIQKLKDIINTQDSNSLAGWAVKEEMKLNQLQEAILFNFATRPTKFDEKENYIPSPKEFIEAFKNEVIETETSFVIDLSGYHYHIPKRKDYIFGNPEKLKAEIERIGNNYQDEINKLKKEVQTINRLEELFSNDFSYSEDHLNAYLNRNEIRTFSEDENLKLTTEQLEERIKVYEEEQFLPTEQKVKALYKPALEKYSAQLNLQATSNSTKATNNTIQTNAFAEAKEIRREFSKIIRKRILLATEVKANDQKTIAWKTQLEFQFKSGKEVFENPFKKNQDDKILKCRSKYKGDSDIQKLISKYSDLRETKGQLQAEIEINKQAVPLLKIQADNKAKGFKTHFNVEFNPDNILQIITEEMLNGEKGIKARESSTKSVYEQEYDNTVLSFEEELKGNPAIKNHNYDLNALILELIPHEIISNKENPEESLESDIENKLAKLSQQIKELSKEEATKIYETVKELKRIVQQQTTYLDTVKAIIAKFKLATYHKVLLDWKFSTEYNLQWIDALNRDISESNFTDTLFGEKTKVNAQELLEINFKKYCNTKTEAKANDILNPFNYYDASARIVDPNDERNPGSTGQNYGMLALLCIAKLSIVDGKTRDALEKVEPGIRILPIDEVAGLGENFDMLYDIAQRLDYQIFTMTITANDLTFQEGKQIYYEFIKNADEKLFEYNEGIQACFSKDNLIDDIETHFADSTFSLNYSTE
jgi:DNA repair protein SbcC/Rad50